MSVASATRVPALEVLSCPELFSLINESFFHEQRHLASLALLNKEVSELAYTHLYRTLHPVYSQQRPTAHNVQDSPGDAIKLARYVKRIVANASNVEHLLWALQHCPRADELEVRTSLPEEFVAAIGAARPAIHHLLIHMSHPDFHADKPESSVGLGGQPIYHSHMHEHREGMQALQMGNVHDLVQMLSPSMRILSLHGFPFFHLAAILGRTNSQVPDVRVHEKSLLPGGWDDSYAQVSAQQWQQLLVPSGASMTHLELDAKYRDAGLFNLSAPSPYISHLQISYTAPTPPPEGKVAFEDKPKPDLLPPAHAPVYGNMPAQPHYNTGVALHQTDNFIAYAPAPQHQQQNQHQHLPPLAPAPPPAPAVAPAPVAPQGQFISCIFSPMFYPDYVRPFLIQVPKDFAPWYAYEPQVSPPPI